ncbi:MAG: hypothetical protein CO189_07390 [candidate division Zixibacteria bacterium CG_4_9_14_3_um_filter_46_8]|nr:MAG: hypothetical protein CO189_07390 [candidate division Zixibacteria bacterium CG_4_9_14_3_um_filter_46_8]
MAMHFQNRTFYGLLLFLAMAAGVILVIDNPYSLSQNTKSASGEIVFAGIANLPPSTITLLIFSLLCMIAVPVILMRYRFQAIAELRHRLSLLVNQRNLKSTASVKRLSDRDIIISDLAALIDSYKGETNDLWMRLEDIRKYQTPILDIYAECLNEEGIRAALNKLGRLLNLNSSAIIKINHQSEETPELLIEAGPQNSIIRDFIISQKCSFGDLRGSDFGQMFSLKLTENSDSNFLMALPLGRVKEKSYCIIGISNPGNSSPPEFCKDELAAFTRAFTIRLNEYEELNELHKNIEGSNRALGLTNILLDDGPAEGTLANFVRGCCEMYGLRSCAIYCLQSQSGEWIRKAFFGSYIEDQRWKRLEYEANDWDGKEGPDNYHIFESEENCEAVFALKNGSSIQGVLRVLKSKSIDETDLLAPKELTQKLAVFLWRMEEAGRIERKQEESLKECGDRLKELDALERISDGIIQASDFDAALNSFSEHLNNAANIPAVFWLSLDHAKSKICIKSVNDDHQISYFSDSIGAELWLKELMKGTDIYEGFPLAEVEDNSKLFRFLAVRGYRYTTLLPLDNSKDRQIILILAKRQPKGLTPSEFRLIKRLLPPLQFMAHKFIFAQEYEHLGNTDQEAPIQRAQSERMMALGEIAGGVVHDFNNLLASVLGRVQLLVMQIKAGNLISNDEVLKNLELIEKMAVDGGQILKKIHDFSKKTKEDEYEIVEIAEAVKDALEITRYRWNDLSSAQGINIMVEKDLQEKSSCLGNATELREVLINMIMNAIDAMPEGGILRIRNTSDVDKNEIIIEDSGIGMDRETMGKVFEPFFTTKGGKGTGLGMSIAFGIISKLNGGIAIESEPGKGTRFTITLPRVNQEADPQCRSLPQVEKSMPARILVIDDEEYIREVLHELLTSKGHIVELAADGEEGIVKFKNGHYEVVITDLEMPGISGWDVAREIKGIAPKTKVVLATGWGTQYQGEDSQSKGIDLLVSKPFDMQAILRIVGNANPVSEMEIIR